MASLPRPLRIFLKVGLLLLTLLLSCYGLIMGLAAAYSAVQDVLGGASITLIGITWGVFMGFAWLAWFVMAIAWVLEKRLHRFWPVSGTIAGCLSIVSTFGFGLAFTFPAVLMAAYLVAFHLRSGSRGG